MWAKPFPARMWAGPRHRCGPGADVGWVPRRCGLGPAQMWAGSCADVGWVLRRCGLGAAQMWAGSRRRCGLGPGADVGWVPAQMWAGCCADVGWVLRRCGLGAAQMWAGCCADVGWVLGIPCLVGPCAGIIHRFAIPQVVEIGRRLRQEELVSATCPRCCGARRVAQDDEKARDRYVVFVACGSLQPCTRVPTRQ